MEQHNVFLNAHRVMKFPTITAGSQLTALKDILLSDQMERSSAQIIVQLAIEKMETIVSIPFIYPDVNSILCFTRIQSLNVLKYAPICSPLI